MKHGIGFIGSHHKYCWAVAKHLNENDSVEVAALSAAFSHICLYSVIVNVRKGELLASSKENIVVIVDFRAREADVLWMLRNLHWMD